MMVRRDPEHTRAELLNAAFEEFYENGFQGTGLDQILKRTQVTKGALYHHFANKMELGYAVVDEVIRPWMRTTWLEPLKQTDDPIAALRRAVDCAVADVDDRRLSLGCPVNNLAQEMSAVDDGFRLRMEGLLEDWRGAVRDALARGIARGTIRRDIDPEATAAFVVASWEGMAGMAKTHQSKELMNSMARVLHRFLEGLRVAEKGTAA